MNKKIYKILFFWVLSIIISNCIVISIIFKYNQNEEKRGLIEAIGEEQYYKLEKIESNYSTTYYFNDGTTMVSTGDSQKIITEP